VRGIAQFVAEPTDEPSIIRNSATMSVSPPYVTAYTNQSVGQVLLHYLGREGVTTIFGIPGGGLANFLVELKNQRDRFRYVVCRQETGAAYIANGYARATGGLGVVAVTSGPGATNAVTGMMTAENDGTGLLILTGEVAEQYFGKGALQEGIDSALDVHAIYNASTAYSAELTDQSEVQTLTEQALRDALGIPRGAAHLALPNNVTTQIVTTPQAPPAPPSPTVYIPNSPANYRTVPTGADRTVVFTAASQLLACQRPLIFLGSGCREALRDQSTRDALVVFAERYAIPVMTTADGKGIFPEGHPLSLRVYGFASNTWPAMWMQQTPTPYDGLLVIATSLRGLSTSNWNPMLVPGSATGRGGPFIQVDLDQQTIGRSFPVTLGVVAEAGAFIRTLADPELLMKFPPDPASVAARQAEVAAIKTQSPYFNPEQYTSTAAPIEPAAIVRVLEDTLPDDTLIFLDAGNCVGWGIHYFTIDAPREIHSSLAMGPMGFGVGAVIGAKMGRPDKTCVALVGDGAFMMHGAEVSTAQAHGVGAIWVVLDDRDLHMVSQGMQYLYPDPNDVWDGLYRLGTPDLVKFAEGLGADGYRIDSPDALAAIMPAVLDKANNQGRPQVIVAAINQKSIDPYFPPKPKSPPSTSWGGSL
jgi:acetolactate synthase-1/2/3 large subunit